MEDEDCLNVDLAGLKGFFGLVNVNLFKNNQNPLSERTTLGAAMGGSRRR